MSAALRLAALAAVPAAMLLGLTAVPAQAETPSSAAICTGVAPADGLLHGPVLLVEDGATLCVALGPTPDQWVKVRLSDARAPSPMTRVSMGQAGAPRGALMAATFSQTVDCQVSGGTGVCLLNGRSVAELAALPTVKTAGAAWR